MNEVVFPDEERVKTVGNLTSAEVKAVGVMVTLLVFGQLVGRLVPALVLIAVVAVWTWLPNRRRPFRLIVPQELGWRLKFRRSWATNVQGGTVAAPAFLGDVTIELVTEGGAPVGVVKNRHTFTVMWQARRSSLAFATDSERAQALASWGDVLGQLSVERHTDLVPAKLGWVDVHHATDPRELERAHQRDGTPGPSSVEYGHYISGFSTCASTHDVVVFAEVNVAQHYRLARKAGMTGSRDEVMLSTATVVGRAIRADMLQRGFVCSDLLTGDQIGGLLRTALDPFAPARERTQLERFGVADGFGPESSAVVHRDRIEIDRSVHRVFRVAVPSIAVPLDWFWRLCNVPGPKVLTAVVESVPPSRADRQRDSARGRGTNNNLASVLARRHVSVKEARKVESLEQVEHRVADGHRELDSYVLVMLTDRTLEGLDHKARALRQAARQCGHAKVIELSGLHDEAVRAVLPIGAQVAADR